MGLCRMCGRPTNGPCACGDWRGIPNRLVGGLWARIWEALGR